VSDIEISAFLSGPRHPELEALLRLIGASILDPHGAEAKDEPPAENTATEWSDGELNELGNMLVRGAFQTPTARACGGLVTAGVRKPAQLRTSAPRLPPINGFQLIMTPIDAPETCADSHPKVYLRGSDWRLVSAIVASAVKSGCCPQSH
jgi:hypothetical protein